MTDSSADVRLYYNNHITPPEHVLQCMNCGAKLFQWSHALERRHIFMVANLTRTHVCTTRAETGTGD